MAKSTKNKPTTKKDSTITVDPRTIKLGHAVEVDIVTPNDDTPEDAELTAENSTTTTKKYASKSQAILDLYTTHNMHVGDIAKALGIRYQFAYNVLKRHGKVGR